jgi:hypothetical protein
LRVRSFHRPDPRPPIFSCLKRQPRAPLLRTRLSADRRRIHAVMGHLQTHAMRQTSTSARTIIPLRPSSLIQGEVSRMRRRPGRAFADPRSWPEAVQQRLAEEGRACAECTAAARHQVGDAAAPAARQGAWAETLLPIQCVPAPSSVSAPSISFFICSSIFSVSALR